MKITLIKSAIVLFLSFLIISCGESTPSGGGQPGSLASMVVAKDQLHILNNDKIVSFDLSGEMLLQGKVSSELDLWQASTLHVHNERYLMVGTDTGVGIYQVSGLEEDTQSLEFVSRFDHVTAEDPVIANGDTGYFTLRDGNQNMASDRDSVGVIDLADIEQPTLITENNALKEPFGLAFYQGQLFVCDKASGLSIFQVISDDNEKVIGLDYLASYANYECNDIIIKNGLLILTDGNGITQLRINGDQLDFVSQLPIFSNY